MILHFWRNSDGFILTHGSIFLIATRPYLGGKDFSPALCAMQDSNFSSSTFLISSLSLSHTHTHTYVNTHTHKDDEFTTTRVGIHCAFATTQMLGASTAKPCSAPKVMSRLRSFLNRSRSALPVVGFMGFHVSITLSCQPLPHGSSPGSGWRGWQMRNSVTLTWLRISMLGL